MPMPCVKTDMTRVLQMMTSAHCTTMIEKRYEVCAFLRHSQRVGVSRT